jgi:hypothetical protein
MRWLRSFLIGLMIYLALAAACFRLLPALNPLFDGLGYGPRPQKEVLAVLWLVPAIAAGYAVGRGALSFAWAIAASIPLIAYVVSLKGPSWLSTVVGQLPLVGLPLAALVGQLANRNSSVRSPSPIFSLHSVLVPVLLALVFCVGYYFAVTRFYFEKRVPNGLSEWGDMFGGLNATLSAFTLLVLFFGLKLQARELVNTVNALKSQTQIQALTSEFQIREIALRNEEIWIERLRSWGEEKYYNGINAAEQRRTEHQKRIRELTELLRNQPINPVRNE